MASDGDNPFAPRTPPAARARSFRRAPWDGGREPEGRANTRRDGERRRAQSVRGGADVDIPRGGGAGALARDDARDLLPARRAPEAPPSKLRDAFGRLRRWATGEEEDGATRRASDAADDHYPFEDGMLGEGLEQYGGDHLAARERHLARREARLERAEASLAAREARQDHGQRAPKNWPPCYPVLRHDIEAEYPPANRPTMRVAHAAWTLAAAGYLLNAVVVTFAFFGAVGASVGDWFLAVAYALAGVPLSRWGWFEASATPRDANRRGSCRRRRTRVSSRTSRSTSSCARGSSSVFPGVGGSCAGIFLALRRLSDASGFGRFVGVLALVNVAVWASATGTSLWVGGEALRRFREGGGVSELRRGGEGRRRRRRVRIGFEFEAMYVCVEA